MQMSFVEADLLDLHSDMLGAGAPADAVFSTATFHCVTDHDRLLANLAPVLGPGGQLWLSAVAKAISLRLLATVRPSPRNEPGRGTTPPRRHRPSTRRRRVRRRAGYGPTEPTTFTPGEQLLDFLEAVCLCGHLATLPADHRRPFIEAVAAATPEP
jgi:trans-aconitate 2-methyltransferase